MIVFFACTWRKGKKERWQETNKGNWKLSQNTYRRIFRNSLLIPLTITSSTESSITSGDWNEYSL